MPLKILNLRKTRLASPFLFSFLLLFQFCGLVSPSCALYPVSPGKPDLELDVDVGSIHFKGEIAEFYILVSQSGKRVNAEIQANIYYNGSLMMNVTSKQQCVETGLFRIPYEIPINASPGTYALVVSASYLDGGLNFHGIGLKSFLVSQTLTAWNAWLIDIQNCIATIKTDIDIVKIDFDKINAALLNINGNVAIIQTDIGIIKTNIETLESKIIDIDGNIFTIGTSIGIDKIEMRLTKIEANIAMINTTIGIVRGNLTSIQGNILNITTALGTFEFNVTVLNATITKIENNFATVQTAVGEIKTSLTSINCRLVSLEGSIATIQTSLGTVKTSISNINAKIASIEGDMATLSTDLGGLNGSIVSIQDGVAKINTDIGQILILINEGLTETPLWWVLIVVIAVGAASSGIYLFIKTR